MEKKKVVDILICSSMREVLNKINLYGLTKEDIVQVVRGDSEWYVLYQKDYGTKL